MWRIPAAAGSSSRVVGCGGPLCALAAAALLLHSTIEGGEEMHRCTLKEGQATTETGVNVAARWLNG